MSIPHVIVIGAGSTGAATAHDLALRGLRVTSSSAEKWPLGRPGVIIACSTPVAAIVLQIRNLPWSALTRICICARSCRIFWN